MSTLFAGMSADGSLVVTSLAPPGGSAGASFLRNSRGWHPLQTLIARAGVDLTGWTIDNIFGMSADGTLVWGSGIHNGATEGVVIEFPSGYLANYVGDAPPVSLVGAWTDDPAGGPGAGALTFLNGGYFMLATEIGRAGGAERHGARHLRLGPGHARVRDDVGAGGYERHRRRVRRRRRGGHRHGRRRLRHPRLPAAGQ